MTSLILRMTWHAVTSAIVACVCGTTPPSIECPSAVFTLHEPVDAPVSTGKIGGFVAPVSAADGATKMCPYTVSYRVVARYDTSKPYKSGSVVSIRIELDDFFGVDAGGRDVPVTAVTVTAAATGATVPPASPGTSLAFHAWQGSRYLYRLKTTGYAPGDYALHIVAGGDPRLYAASFVIR